MEVRDLRTMHGCMKRPLYSVERIRIIHKTHGHHRQCWKLVAIQLKHWIMCLKCRLSNNENVTLRVMRCDKQFQNKMVTPGGDMQSLYSRQQSFWYPAWNFGGKMFSFKFDTQLVCRMLRLTLCSYVCV